MKDIINMEIEAIDLAKKHHEGQFYGNKDYFNYHICGVVGSLFKSNLNPNNIEHLIVGYLHDILEDTEVTYNQILEMFGSVIADAVLAITKKDSETRNEYLKRCKSNEISRIVKIHDAMFNAKECLNIGDMSRLKYYINTIKVLINE